MRIISPDTHRADEHGRYDASPETSAHAYKVALKEWHMACYGASDDCVLRMMVTVGIPGSGKSTFLENGRGAFWRREMAQIDVVFDATLTSRLGRRPLIEIARDSGNAVVEALVFDVPLAKAILRNAKRPEGRRVPHSTMMRMASQMETEPPTVAEGLWRVTSFKGPGRP